MSTNLIDKVFENHYARKLYHMFGGGLLVLGLVFLNTFWFILLDSLYVLGFWIFGKRISFAAIGVMLLLILSGSKPITLMATLIWLVGDGLAGFIGAAYGTTKWPWHKQKSIQGSIAFLVGSFLMILLFLEMKSDLNPSIRTAFLFVPCLAACIIETLPISIIKDRKPDDNLIVILSTGVVLKILFVLFQVKDWF